MSKNTNEAITLTVLHNDGKSESIFKDFIYELDNLNGLMISPRINTLNFRHRKSMPGYISSWHVAGDPTLIIIRQGVLRIGLRDGSYRDFSAGDQFVAQDYLAENGMFNDQLHGHTAKLIGDEELLAVHIKLAAAIV